MSCVLRFYHYFEIPFTHDEFSALFRTDHNSFGELIRKGVYPDGHPAGVQVFLYYWVKLVGMTEWLIKLPFTLAGVAAVLFFYKIGKIWYNETVALICVAFISSMEMMVMYSQIARPYITGLLFVLSMAYFWSLLIHKPERNFIRNGILYILSATLAAYNHHFSLLFVIVLGFAGLLFIHRDKLWYYITFGIAVFLLYIPHLQILSAQIEIGGIEGWLAKPTISFFGGYLRYLFNFSVPEYLVIFGIIILGLVQARPNSFTFRKFLLFLLLFGLPLTIGYLYSIYFSAVLQFSVLIFSTPFLLFALFGHLSNQRVLINTVVVLLILSVGAYGLVKERRFYSLFYKSPYEVILTDLEKVKSEFPGTNALIDSHRKISAYYIEINSINHEFKWFTDLSSTAELLSYLDKSSQESNHIYFGTLPENPPNTVALIRDYFPYLIWQKNYAGASTYFFSSESEPIENTQQEIHFGLDYDTKWSNILSENFLVDSATKQMNSYIIRSNSEWSITYSDTLKNWNLGYNDFIDIKTTGVFKNKPENVLAVATLTDIEGKLIYWGSSNFDEFAKTDSFPQKISLTHLLNFLIFKV